MFYNSMNSMNTEWKAEKNKFKKKTCNQFVMHLFIPTTPHMYLFYLPKDIQSNTSILIAIHDESQNLVVI